MEKTMEKLTEAAVPGEKMNLYVIASHYGYEHQSRQCIEEMAELTKAINKHWRKEIPNRNNYELLQGIYEEIADVEVCLEQMKILLNCHGEVEAMRNYKINREIKRITESLERGLVTDE